MIHTLTFTEKELEDLLTKAARLGVEEYCRRSTIGSPDRVTLTLQQLAEEWQCTKQSIRNWMERDYHPLPVHYLGSAPRFHRFEVESWSRAEALRRKEKVS